MLTCVLVCRVSEEDSLYGGYQGSAMSSFTSVYCTCQRNKVPVCTNFGYVAECGISVVGEWCCFILTFWQCVAMVRNHSQWSVVGFLWYLFHFFSICLVLHCCHCCQWIWWSSQADLLCRCGYYTDLGRWLRSGVTTNPDHWQCWSPSSPNLFQQPGGVHFRCQLQCLRSMSFCFCVFTQCLEHLVLQV